MSIEAIKEKVYGIKKKAFVTQAVGDAANAAVGIGTTGSVYLLALAATAGLGVGYVGAKMSAHGKQDIDTVKKEYENERLKADLGYLKGKTESEYEAFKRAKDPKAARVFV